MEATPATSVQPSYPPFTSAEGPFRDKQEAIQACVWRAWSVYQCWRRGCDLMSGRAAWAKHRVASHHCWNTRDVMRHLRYLAKILEMGNIFLWAKQDTDSAPGWGQQVPGTSPRTAGCSGDICHCPPWMLERVRPNCILSSGSLPPNL